MSHYLEKLKEQIIIEFDKYDNMDQVNPKDIGTLLIKVKSQIDQMKNDISTRNGAECSAVSQNQNQMADGLMKFQTVAILKELREKIVDEFNMFKSFNMDGEAEQTDAKNLETFLFKVNYQIDHLKNSIISGSDEEECSGNKNVDFQKADALIKLQTLASSITCHILNLDNNL